MNYDSVILIKQINFKLINWLSAKLADNCSLMALGLYHKSIVLYFHLYYIFIFPFTQLSINCLAIDSLAGMAGRLSHVNHPARAISVS